MPFGRRTGEGGCVAGGFECSPLELDIVGDAFGLNVRQFPFDFPVHGETIEERARFIQVVQRSLSAKGLVDEKAFAPAVEQLIGLFCRGRISIAMLGVVRGRSICARASTDGQHAVLARRHGETVRFDPITPASLVRVVVALLPPTKAGPGGSVTIAVPDEPNTSARTHVEDFAGRTFMEPVSPARTSASAQAAVAAEILRRPRRGSGYFVVTERRRNDIERDPATVNWLDTDAGRYVVVPSVGSDGCRYGTYAPADLRRIDQHLSCFVPVLR
jgi:hypothetical protein